VTAKVDAIEVVEVERKGAWVDETHRREHEEFGNEVEARVPLQGDNQNARRDERWDEEHGRFGGHGRS
jgi:hypothetical protein